MTKPDVLDAWEREARLAVRSHENFTEFDPDKPHQCAIGLYPSCANFPLASRVLRLIAAVRKYRELMIAAGEFDLTDLKKKLEGTPHADTVEVAYGAAMLAWDAARTEAEALLSEAREK